MKNFIIAILSAVLTPVFIFISVVLNRGEDDMLIQAVFTGIGAFIVLFFMFKCLLTVMTPEEIYKEMKSKKKGR